MRTMIVAGGDLRPAFFDAWQQRYAPDFLIAADRGLDVILAALRDASCASRNQSAAGPGRLPDLVLGDFDSAREAWQSRLQEWGIPCEVYPCEKDFSDMESALREAVRRGSTEIVVLGATGGRLDHFLANLMDLRIPLQAGIPARIVDEQNVIYLKDGSFSIKRREAFGKYLSLLPLTGRAEHVGLKGFKYEGEDLILDQSLASLGISNELREEEARVEFSGSILVVIESADR